MPSDESLGRMCVLAGLALLVSLAGPAQAELAFEVVKGFELAEHEPSELTVGADGTLYGTTTSGGASGMGTIFRLDAAGAVTRLHAFRRSDGSRPLGGLVLGRDGALYGMTLTGGSADGGTIFRIDGAGNFESLYSFARSGSYPGPSHGLIRGPDGALYGAGAGMLFRLDYAGNVAPLLSVPSVTGLVFASDGSLYVSTYFFSSSFGSFSTILRYEGSGSPSTLYSSSNSAIVSLVLGGDGAVYATARDALGDHSLLRVGVSGVTPFHPGPLSSTPLTVGSDGGFYGFSDSRLRTSSLVRIDLAGNLTTLHSFPIVAPPSWNRKNAGSVVRLRFALGGDQGPAVLAPGSPRVATVSCDSDEPAVGGSAPGPKSRLEHRRGSSRYTYVWKTAKRWAGTCKELSLELRDGSVHRARFDFRRRRATH